MKENKLMIQVFTDFEYPSGDDKLKKIALFIGNLYEYNLPKITTKVKKLVIELVNEIDYFVIIPDDSNSSIYSIRKGFDFDIFQNIDYEEKRLFLIEFTYDCLKSVFEKLGFDLEDLYSTYNCILSEGFKLDIPICNTPINNKIGVTAVVIAEHHVDYALISLYFYFKDSTVRKISLYKTIPHSFIYLQVVNKAKWLNNEIFEIFNNTKEIILRIDINLKITTIYKPDNREIKDVQEELIFLTHEIMYNI